MARSSSVKVPYDLRPSKQVERRIFVDIFQEMAQAGFPIRSYTYIGMGSLFFIDFIMFHKYIGIEKMITVEHDSGIERRLRFNQPFKNVRIVMDEIGNVIAGLDRDTRYLMWLDYDEPFTASAGEDVRLAASSVRSGSVLLVSVPIFPGRNQGPAEIFSHYHEQVGDYLGIGDTIDMFSPNRIVKTLAAISMRIVKAGLQGRKQMYFEPLIYLRYSDGREMLTFGGIICDSADRRNIRGCDFRGRDYVRRSLARPPFIIDVPVLTRKERANADACMPKTGLFLRRTLGFSDKEIKNYRNIYRFLPSYGELLIG